MATRSNIRIVERATNMARFSMREEEDETPIATRIANKRPRCSVSASPSQPQRPVRESQPVQRPQSQSQTRSRTLERVEEDAALITVEEVESDTDSSDSDSSSDSQEFEEDEEVEEDDGEDNGSEDDEGSEAQNQLHQVTVTAASSHLEQRNVVLAAGGLRSCSTVASVSSTASGSISVVLTDPDVLDCPICLEPLCAPIYQCENGHIACSLCCSKVKRKCPSCCMPIGYNRCRAIEKVIESIKITCKNTRFGCKETITYNKKAEHEQICPHIPCSCPHTSCTFAGPFKNLYIHFSNQHTSSAFHFIYDTTFSLRVEKSQKHILLQEKNEKVIFILNQGVGGHGRVFNVDCIGPSSLKSAFVYQINAKFMETSLSLHSVPEICTEWSEHTPTKNYLTVPSDFARNCGPLSLHLCIKKSLSIV